MYFRLRAGSHGSKAAKTGSTNPTRALWWWWSLANRANGFAGGANGFAGAPICAHEFSHDPLPPLEWFA